MDEQWALAKLQTFVAMTTLREEYNADAMMTFDVLSSPESNIVYAAQTIEKILDNAIPRWRSQIPEQPQWQQHHVAAVRAIAELTNRAEVAAKMGENAPEMNAGALHPWVWESARSLWQSGHYREAVRAASVKINAETQNKVGTREISETALFEAALSDDAPVPGRSRLRPRGDDGGKTSLSLRRGIAAFAKGCYAAIRNPASHDEGELSEQEGLEQLAAFSVLARWLDGATIQSA